MRIGMAAGAALLVLILGTDLARAQVTSAAVTVTHAQVNPQNGKFDYTLSLTNTGTTGIKSFWFGWVVYYPEPYNYIYDLLPSNPSIVNSPGTWIGVPQQDGIVGGYYSAVWKSNTALASGSTMNGFMIETTDPDAAINTNSTFGYANNTSWVYENFYTTAPPAGGSSGPIIPNVVAAPEPCLGLIVPGLLMVWRRRRAAR